MAKHPLKKATRKDVAREAGVSMTTVTYVLRNTPGANISAGTRERVKRVARRLNYHPNFAATSLVRGKTHIAALVLPKQANQFLNYYARMIAGLVSEADSTPYHFLYLAMDRPEKCQRCIDEGYVDGIVLLQSVSDDAHVRWLQRYRKPMVTMNYRSELAVPSITVDYEGALETCYRELVARGRRRIALLYVEDNVQPNIRTLKRHRQLAQELAPQASIEFIDLKTPYSAAATEEVVRRVLASPQHDGFVVEGLLSTNAVLRHAERRGMALMQDYDLAAINILDDANHYRPGVLVLDAPHEVVGQKAWQVLHQQLQGQEPEQPSYTVSFGVRGAEAWRTDAALEPAED
jgi:DNA-binding LacI/PurR family transcriptional regulator